MRTLVARQQTPEERVFFLQVLQRMMMEDRLTMGQALRLLRKVHLGMTRREYAKRVGLSNTAMGHLENDAGNPTLGSLSAAFKPLGLRVGLWPVCGSAVVVSPPSLDEARYAEASSALLAALEGG